MASWPRTLGPGRRPRSLCGDWQSRYKVCDSDRHCNLVAPGAVVADARFQQIEGLPGGVEQDRGDLVGGLAGEEPAATLGEEGPVDAGHLTRHQARGDLAFVRPGLLGQGPDEGGLA